MSICSESVLNNRQIQRSPLGIREGMATSLLKRKELSVSSDMQPQEADGFLLSGRLFEDYARKRSPWAAPGALAFQLLILSALIIIPLYHTDVLPKPQVLTMLYAPPPPPPPPPAATRVNTVSPHVPRPVSIPDPKTISAPTPHREQPVEAADAGGVPGGVPGGVVGGVVGGVPGGVLGGVLGAPSSAPTLASMTSAAPRKVHVAPQLAEGNLIHDVTPEYPPEAGRNRIEGAVLLLAVIGKDGSVRDLQVQSGLPLLAQAAIAAVRQWRYRPYLLNGQPVEVETQIVVNFTLSGA